METETIFVAGCRWFRVCVADGGESLRATVTVAMDGRHEWTYEEPSWRPIAFGFGAESSYLWSARELIRLPRLQSDEPVVEVSTDEDLIFVFEHAGGWVLVCETSVRRVLGGEQTGRWELPEVAVRAVWRGEALAVLDEAGEEALLRVDGPDLVPVMP
ncbi:MAG: hypothetical protein Q8P38_10695 [Candidatus Nanopelagicales bacterium]|nr:hypothetical protein [Candidatus Nanopelagicales bacterium]